MTAGARPVTTVIADDQALVRGGFGLILKAAGVDVLAETADGEVAGVSLSLPDYNHVLARLDGRLLPTGWAKALLAQRQIREIRVFALGVKPEFQHTGVAAALYRDVWDACRRRGMRRAETGWILETNDPMNRAMEALTGQIVKRYRVFEHVFDA